MLRSQEPPGRVLTRRRHAFRMSNPHAGAPFREALAVPRLGGGASDTAAVFVAEASAPLRAAHVHVAVEVVHLLFTWREPKRRRVRTKGA